MTPRLLSEDLKAQIAALPSVPGVYLFKNKSDVPVYIGKAVSIRKRVSSHFRSYGETFSKEGILLREVATIDFIETPTEADALLLEASLVKQHQPKFNKELKDDKSYPFLKITDEKYPRLLIVRGRKPGGIYFGPYTSGKLLKEAVGMLRRLFPMRTCRPMPKEACLMYHIGQCKAPCIGEIGESEYGQIVRELQFFLQGRRESYLKGLLKRMKAHSEKREYEKAMEVYKAVQALSSMPRAGRNKFENVLSELMDALLLPQLPIRIEAFDISNLSGREAVGSMVVFLDAKPARSQYRRFRIRSVKGIDDYEMMREVVRRRYTRLLNERQRLPDLVLIDGGKGHLAAAKRELDALGLEALPILSIAKQHEHLFSPRTEGPVILPQNSPILHLIQQLRDEAHRFAITYHRRLHKKEAILSRLDAVQGVGPKTRQRLLKVFGSVARIRKATEEELAARGRVPPPLARRILKSLEETS